MMFTYTVLAAPFFWFTFESRTIEILLKVLAVMIFPLILYIFRFYEPIEIKTFRGFVNKYIFRIKV